MIRPRPGDEGRAVLYENRPWNDARERGVITSWNDHFVFVRYGSDVGSKATRREDLHWENDYARV